MENYRRYQKEAATARSYLDRVHAMPTWQALAPGLVEFGPEPGQKNIGFKTSFERYSRPILDKVRCIDCKICHLYCPDGAIDFQTISFDLEYCTGCGICAQVCPPKAISMLQELEVTDGLKEEKVSTVEEALREYGY